MVNRSAYHNIFSFLGLLSALTLVSACGGKSFSLPADSASFVQTDSANTKVDIVMLVDDSSSMIVPQKELADQIPSMIQALEAQGMDWRIAVTTTDMSGRGRGGHFMKIDGESFISAKTPNAIAKVQSMINAGDLGDDLEQGLISLKEALDESRGQLRDDAVLNIMMLSNEDDWGALQPADFIKFMDQLKPRFRSGFRSWTAHYFGILSINDPKCKSKGNWSQVGKDYIAVANAVGGVVESICEKDLKQAAQNVRVRMDDLVREFPLNRVPKVESIKVHINGKEILSSTTDGWEYLPSKNVIRFNGRSVPTPQDMISVTFDPNGAT